MQQHQPFKIVKFHNIYTKEILMKFFVNYLTWRDRLNFCLMRHEDACQISKGSKQKRWAWWYLH